MAQTDLESDMLTMESRGVIKGEKRERKKWKEVVAKKDAALKEQNVLIKEKDAALADKDAQIAELMTRLGKGKSVGLNQITPSG